MISVFLWGLFIVLTIIVIVGYFGKSKIPSGLPNTWKPSENVTLLTAMWAFLLIFLPMIVLTDDIRVPYTQSLRDMWWGILFSWKGFLITIGFIIFGYTLPEDPKAPFRFKLAKFGMVTLILITSLFVWETYSHRFGTNQNFLSMFFSDSGNEPAKEKVSGKMRRAETQDYVTSFWYKNLPVADAREMINISQCESGFNHWDDGGSIVVNKNVDGSIDWGVMQVNDKVWGGKAEELGHDIQSLDGNLQMALYIRKEKGASEWACHQKIAGVKDEVTLIPAPEFPEWSPVQKVKANCIWENTAPVLIKDENGKVYRKNPGETINVITWTFQISTPEGETPGEMRYMCR